MQIKKSNCKITMTVRQLSKVLQDKTHKELNEVPGRNEDDLKNIKEWINKQPHLKVRLDDQWLLGFLRGCKFSLQRTKEKIDMFYTIKSILPEIFENRDPFLPEIQAILNKCAVIPLPISEDSTNPRVLFVRLSVCDPETITMLHLAKIYFMFLDILMYEDDNIMISGKQLVVDLTGFSLNYMLQITPSFIKKIVTCFQNVYPIRIKGMYCTNAPGVFETVFNLAKSLLTEKLRNRTFMYSESNSNKVYDYIPHSVFPKDYGGQNGSVDKLAKEWKKKVEDYRDFFLEEGNYGSDETLRAGKPQTSADVFGVEGSFRKLAID